MNNPHGRQRPPDDHGPVAQAVTDNGAGRMVIVETTDHGAHLVLPAASATPTAVGFMIRHSSGILCAAMPDNELDRLDLAVGSTVDVHVPESSVSGSSATARSHTLRALSEPSTGPEQLQQPGHVFAISTAQEGVLRTRRHVEAAVDLARLSSAKPIAVVTDLVDESGEPLQDSAEFARDHNLTTITVDDLVAYRRRTEKHLIRLAQVRLPLSLAATHAVGYRSTIDGAEHLAVIHGDLGDGIDVPVHSHPECLLGDVFGARICDCRRRLDAAITTMHEHGRGIVLYLRQPPRDHTPPAAEGSQVLSMATSLHPAADQTVSAEILHDLEVVSVINLTDQPDHQPVLAPASLSAPLTVSATA